MMTNQEIFDKVVEHLIRQGQKSVGILKADWTECVYRSDKVLKCVYRSDKGLKCAVGCLIADHAYTPSLEGRPVEEPSVIDALTKSINIDVQSAIKLLADLQLAHDSDNSWKNIASMQHRLILVAAAHSLDTSRVQQFTKFGI